jgi:hypothetical protein
VQEDTGIHADVFKRVNAAYPYGVRLWDEDTGNTFEVRLCKSLDDAIYLARGATISQRALRAPTRPRGRIETNLRIGPKLSPYRPSYGQNCVSPVWSN